MICLNGVICDAEYGECPFPTGPDSETSPGSGSPPNTAVPPSTGTPPTIGTPPPGSVTPSPPGQTWCVAIENAGEDKLKSAMEYACGEGGADCGPIQPGSTCYNPNTLEAHASYAFNSFYQRKGREHAACDFNGAAYVVDEPPRKYHFPLELYATNFHYTMLHSSNSLQVPHHLLSTATRST